MIVHFLPRALPILTEPFLPRVAGASGWQTEDKAIERLGHVGDQLVARCDALDAGCALGKAALRPLHVATPPAGSWGCPAVGAAARRCPSRHRRRPSPPPLGP